MSRILLNSLVIMSAIGAAVLAVSKTVDFSALKDSSEKRERCYGVVRAGKNDCGTSTHACAAQSEVDGNPESWIMVPKGLCDKLISGVRRSNEG